MSEAVMRGRVVLALRELDAHAIENPIHPGTPDINYVEGWIELKWLRSWPKRADTVIPLEHFTKQQRIWLLRRARYNGNVYLLLQVNREWLLIHGRRVAHIGFLRKQELIGISEKYYPDGLDGSDLCDYLKGKNS
jgi:hypothetical protein